MTRTKLFTTFVQLLVICTPIIEGWLVELNKQDQDNGLPIGFNQNQIDAQRKGENFFTIPESAGNRGGLRRSGDETTQSGDGEDGHGAMTEPEMDNMRKAVEITIMMCIISIIFILLLISCRIATELHKRWKRRRQLRHGQTITYSRRANTVAFNNLSIQGSMYAVERPGHFVMRTSYHHRCPPSTMPMITRTSDDLGEREINSSKADQRPPPTTPPPPYPGTAERIQAANY